MKPSGADRLMQLEETVRQLTRRIDQVETQRLAEAVPPANPRLAKTFDDGSYPSSGSNPNKYPFVFVDPAIGGSVTFDTRSDSKQGEAIWYQQRYLPIGTIISVAEQRNGIYSIEKAYTPASRIFATVSTAFTSGDATVPWSSFSSSHGVDGSIPTGMSSATIKNRFSWDGTVGWLVLMEFDDSDQSWYLLQMYCE